MNKEDNPDWDSGRGYGVCQEVMWERPAIKGDTCLTAQKTWVKRPCDMQPDPTAFSASGYTNRAAAYGDDEAPHWNKGFCKDDIKPADLWGPDRKFNLFSADDPSLYDQDPESATYGTCTGAGSTVPNACMKGNSKYTRETCFAPAKNMEVCVWWQSKENAYFDTVSLYGGQGMATFMQLCAVIVITFYFVTSSDSGSYVVDMISANGDQDPPVIQRIFWSFTEGLCACMLLYAGTSSSKDDGALKALQAASLVMGLPFTLVLFWCSQALLQVVKDETGEYDKNRPAFKAFIFSFDHHGQGTGTGLKKLGIALLLPGINAGNIMEQVDMQWPAMSAKGWGIFLQILFTANIIMDIIGELTPAAEGDAPNFNVKMLGAAVYCLVMIWLSLIRREFRTKRGIPRGDFITDFLSTLFAYPFAIVQMEAELGSDVQAYKKTDATEMTSVQNIGKPQELEALVQKLVEQELTKRKAAGIPTAESIEA